MKKSFLKKVALGVITLMFVASCNVSEMSLPELTDNAPLSSEKNDSILSFTDKNSLVMVLQGDESTKTSLYSVDENANRKTLDNLVTTVRPELPISESLYGRKEYADFWAEYVPNPNFAKLLNKDGEIIVNDTIYKITPNGTYFFPRAYKLAFTRIYAADSSAQGNLIGDKLYIIAKNIYRYDTFGKNTEDESVEYFGKSSTELITKNIGAEPDYKNFPAFNSDRQTVIGKLIQNLIGAKKDFTVYYELSKSRRVKGSFYSYNYVAYAECGAEGWTDKENWIGWSKTPSEELRVGWNDVVLVTELTDYSRQAMKNIAAVPTIMSQPQYLDIPGSMYKMDVRTMTIRDFKADLFDKAIALGTTAVFDYLRSKLGSNADLNKSTTYLILTPTHLITYIPNQDVVKFNCERYAHVFASQIKFLIGWSSTSFPSSVAQYANIFTNAIRNSSEMNYPTLAGGTIHVAAKFGREWQGMVIKKASKVADIIK
ncbi:MAG: hypothetical protein LBH04_11875 [Tannerellaceae bacterium]|jgi:hypothetical protein|nr:hypothetical protein [Tannerellaceae bacterium]